MKASEIIKKPVAEDTGIAKAALKKAGKYAPLGAGVAFGLADMTARAADKDYVGAGLAGLSTAAATVPGPGTALSTGIDAFNVARDVAKDEGGWKPLGKKVAKGLATQEPFLPESELDEDGLLTKLGRYAGEKLPQWLRRGEKAVEKVPPKSKYTTDADRVIDFGKEGGGLPKAVDVAKSEPGMIRRAAGAVGDAAKKGALGAVEKTAAVGTTVAGLGLGGGLVYGGYKGWEALNNKAGELASDEFNKPSAEPGVTPPNQVSPRDSVNKDEKLEYDPEAEARKETERLFGPEAVKEAADTKLDPAVLAAIQRGIYGNESGYGKAKTDKPNYAGARGPMQIIPGTFDWMKKSGIIPKDYDIKNPEQNRAAGNALIAHYYNKYEGDPAKVFAAYYAGPGSINKDGTINTHWRDKKNPKAPNVGGYIDQGLAKAGLSNITYASAKPGTTTQIAAVSTPSTLGGAAKPATIDDEEARLFGLKPTLSVKDLAKDQAGLAAVLPNIEKTDFASSEALRLAAVEKAKDQFNKQTTDKNAEALSESKTVQVVEPINTNADLTDLLRLAGRRKI
jgi:hypothetical protein